MFRNSYQSGFLSILYSVGNKPLKIWAQHIRNGHIKRITDNDINSAVLHIQGNNVATTYITCPANPKQTLGIKLPYLVMIIKNLKKYFSFEVQVLDDRNIRRRFRASIYQSTTRVKPFICTMPMRLDEGWNQIQFNLGDFTSRAYNTVYFETLRVQIHATCRIRRIFFSSKLFKDEELPEDYKLMVAQNKDARGTGSLYTKGGAGKGPAETMEVYKDPNEMNEDDNLDNAEGDDEGAGEQFEQDEGLDAQDEPQEGEGNEDAPNDDGAGGEEPQEGDGGEAEPDAQEPEDME